MFYYSKNCCQDICHFKSVTKKSIIGWRTYSEEFTSILIAVVDPDGPTADTEIKTDSEVSWLEWHLRSVLLQDHLAVKEGSLHGACIDLLWFNHEDGPVLKEVVDNQLYNSEVLEARFNNTLLEISEKSQPLYKFK